MVEEHETALVRQQQLPVTVIVQVPAQVVMYNISEPELDSLVASDPSLHFGFLGIALGAFLGFVVTLLTVDLEGKLFATFVALTAVSGLAWVYFAIRSIGEHKAAQQRLERIKSRRQ